jgi:hypothetical protein
MALFLLEFTPSMRDRSEVRPLLDDVTARVQEAGGEVVEAQVAADLQRIYVIAEHTDREALATALRDGRYPAVDIAEVRLVGATLEELKAAKGGKANYLVEWDLPAELTMEAYLERKRAKAPNYAKVPEVRFLRTYVREDMEKCLCLYDAPDADAVCRAREAVETPIDRLIPLATDERPAD